LRVMVNSLIGWVYLKLELEFLERPLVFLSNTLSGGSHEGLRVEESTEPHALPAKVLACA
jgi:hypothetical protein